MKIFKYIIDTSLLTYFALIFLLSEISNFSLKRTMLVLMFHKYFHKIVFYMLGFLNRGAVIIIYYILKMNVSGNPRKHELYLHIYY